MQEAGVAAAVGAAEDTGEAVVVMVEVGAAAAGVVLVTATTLLALPVTMEVAVVVGLVPPLVTGTAQAAAT